MLNKELGRKFITISPIKKNYSAQDTKKLHSLSFTDIAATLSCISDSAPIYVWVPSEWS